MMGAGTTKFGKISEHAQESILPLRVDSPQRIGLQNPIFETPYITTKTVQSGATKCVMTTRQGQMNRHCRHPMQGLEIL